MNYPLPASIKPEEVKRLVESLNQITGVRAEVSYVFTLNVEDPKVLKILEILYGSVEPPVKEVAKHRSKFDHSKIASKNVEQLLASSKSWELIGGEDGKEVIGKFSIEEKGQMLARGKFEEGARLRYAKNGKYYRVHGSAGNPQQLVG